MITKNNNGKAGSFHCHLLALILCDISCTTMENGFQYAQLKLESNVNHNSICCLHVFCYFLYLLAHCCDLFVLFSRQKNKCWTFFQFSFFISFQPRRLAKKKKIENDQIYIQTNAGHVIDKGL